MGGVHRRFFNGYTGPRVSREAHCLSSALANPVVVQEKLQKEIQLGTVGLLGLSSVSLFLSCNALQQKYTFRLIHHLSFPSGDPLMISLIGNNAK